MVPLNSTPPSRLYTPLWKQLRKSVSNRLNENSKFQKRTPRLGGWYTGSVPEHRQHSTAVNHYTNPSSHDFQPMLQAWLVLVLKFGCGANIRGGITGGTLSRILTGLKGRRGDQKGYKRALYPTPKATIIAAIMRHLK